MKRLFPLGMLALLGAVWGIAALSPLGTAAEKDAARKPENAAVERARKQIRTLDHIYKTTVVLITDKYVNKPDDFPAGSAAVALFKSVTDAGHHKVRLIDATGMPYEKANVARDDFEKEGVRQLKSGQASYEAIESVDGKPHLRTVTAVPVVSKKCIMCHPHYADAKSGAAIGAISYSVPIE
ncbi:MAG: DUF3365 domain-containing protein [Planctomycetaceae bacterium]|nr:DUF3365 domain-containing protein [Planctomycetaceae bacterium]